MKPRPIINHASDWARIELGKDHGTVLRIVTCPDCGALRYAGNGPHALRWLDGRRVDCVGREVAL